MSQIGNLGKLIVFEVSSDKVLTFTRLQQSVGGRWTTHSPIGSKPQSEFLGPDTRSASLQISLNATLGVRPRDTLTRIENAAENGEHFPLVIGGKRIGNNEWAISKVSESWDVVYGKGELVSCSVGLTLTEYVGG